MWIQFIYQIKHYNYERINFKQSISVTRHPWPLISIALSFAQTGEPESSLCIKKINALLQFQTLWSKLF